MNELELVRGLSTALADLVSRLAPSVLGLRTDEGGYRSGLLIGASEVLSFARDAEDGEEVTGLTGKSGQAPTEVRLKVRGRDNRSNLVLLTAESLPGGLEPCVPADGLPALGSIAVTVAFPSPEGQEARLGLVRCVSAENHYFQTDSAAFPGFAGAPVVGADGRVLGLTALGEEPGSAWVLPIADALAAAKSLGEKGSRRASYLGIVGSPVALPDEARAAPPAAEGGLMLLSVDRDGPSAAAGLAMGDVLVSVGGSPVADQTALMRVLSETEAGAKAAVVVWRAGSYKSFEVTTSARREAVARRHRGGHWHGKDRHP